MGRGHDGQKCGELMLNSHGRNLQNRSTIIAIEIIAGGTTSGMQTAPEVHWAFEFDVGIQISIERQLWRGGGGHPNQGSATGHHKTSAQHWEQSNRI